MHRAWTLLCALAVADQLANFDPNPLGSVVHQSAATRKNLTSIGPRRPPTTWGDCDHNSYIDLHGVDNKRTPRATRSRLMSANTSRSR